MFLPLLLFAPTPYAKDHVWKKNQRSRSKCLGRATALLAEKTSGVESPRLLAGAWPRCRGLYTTAPPSVSTLASGRPLTSAFASSERLRLGTVPAAVPVHGDRFIGTRECITPESQDASYRPRCCCVSRTRIYLNRLSLSIKTHEDFTASSAALHARRSSPRAPSSRLQSLRFRPFHARPSPSHHSRSLHIPSHPVSR